MAKAHIRWQVWEPKIFESAAKSRKPLFVWVAPFWSLGGPMTGLTQLEEGSLRDLIASSFIAVALDPEEYPQVPLWYGLSEFPAALVLAPDGEARAALILPDAQDLRKALAAVSTLAAQGEEAVRKGMALHRAPDVTAANGNLERGLEVLESIKARVSQAIDRETFAAEPAPAQIAALSFLTHYSLATGESEPMTRAILQIHGLCHSPLYDAVEGGFFGSASGGRVRTFKLLSHNAEWLMLVVGLRRDPDADFVLPMARGILHYLHSRLLLPSGGFGNAQCEDPAYYGLSGEGRRQIEMPPVDRTVYTASNARVVRALCEGWRLLGEPEYLQRAMDTFGSLRSWVEDSNGVLSHARRARPLGEGTLDDAVEMGLAYLALYHSTLEPEYLEGVSRMAGQVARDFRNPAGEGFLHTRLPPGLTGVRIGPVVDPAQNARAALFLLVASAHLADESLSVSARGVLGTLAASPPKDMEALGGLGDALLVALFPLAVYEVITDGSKEQRFRVLERLRQMGPSLAVITHRLPSPREGMQRLPRLVGYCGTNRHEVAI